MNKRVFVLMLVMLGALAAGCSSHQANDLANANATASPTTTVGPDNSEITTSVDASGTRTETRTFRNNPHISRVVVTTRDGRRTVKAYSPSGEEREVTTDDNVLEATGDKIASAAGFVADKAEDVAGETADKAEDVGDKTVSGAKKVGTVTADKAEDVGDKAVSTSKKVGEKTVEGAKKVGSETKKAVKKVIP